MESRNPGGSVKDRIALNMVLDAEEKGIIEAMQTEDFRVAVKKFTSQSK